MIQKQHGEADVMVLDILIIICVFIVQFQRVLVLGWGVGFITIYIMWHLSARLVQQRSHVKQSRMWLYDGGHFQP